MRGRKPVPLEQRVRRGDVPPAVLTHLEELAELRPNDGRPAPPSSLGEAGRRVWETCWAASWLTAADGLLVERLAVLADTEAELVAELEQVALDRRWRQRRLLLDLDAHRLRILAELGLTPVSRTRIAHAVVEAHREGQRNWATQAS